MKRYLIVLAVLICAGSLWSAQLHSSQNTAAPQATPTPQAQATALPTPDLPGSTVVLTIHNVCEANVTPCETKITKDEFDLIYKTFGSKNGPPAERTGLAEKYVRLLAMANGGAKSNLDETPEAKLQLHLAKLQALAQLYQKKVSEDAANVTDEDIKKYYDENATQFEELTVRHIIVPHVSLPEPSASPVAGASPAPTADLQKKRQEEDEATKALAEKAHKRLVAGEDPDKVEKDIYAEANSKGTPPSTAASPRHHGNFPAAEEADIFQLKPGEVSKVLNAGYALEIYKIESKTMQPLDKVKDEIKHKLTNKRMTDAMQQIMVSSNPDYNEKYFTVPPQNVTNAPNTPANVRPTR